MIWRPPISTRTDHSFPSRRSSDLSYEGVVYEIVEHDLTPEQVAIYDSYADAFKIIHQNIEAALEAANITGPEGTLNRNAKAAARSAFESNKQRFFNHLLTALKCPTLIAAIERDLEAGHTVVVPGVSTGEGGSEEGRGGKEGGGTGGVGGGPHN